MKSRARCRWITSGFLTWIWTLFAYSPARGQDGQPGMSAEISIRVIYAVKSETNSVDPALEDIRQELEVMPFNKFRLLDRLSTDADFKSAVELQFGDGKSLSVRFLGIDESKQKRRLSLELSMKPALKIQLRVADGGRTLLGGPSHQDGNLILDISAKLKEKTK